jgi:hypothetical protein
MVPVMPKNPEQVLNGELETLLGQGKGLIVVRIAGILVDDVEEQGSVNPFSAANLSVLDKLRELVVGHFIIFEVDLGWDVRVPIPC